MNTTMQTSGRVLKIGVSALGMLLLIGMVSLAPYSVCAQATPAFGNDAPRQYLTIENSKSQLMRLQQPSKDIFIACPEIADVQVASPYVFTIFGKKQGSTTIFALDDQGKAIAAYEVRVDKNLSPLREDIRRICPNNAITVGSLNAGILLTGSVASTKTAAEAVRLAEAYLSPNETVVNNLAVSASTQVNLRVRVAEVARTTQNVYGSNLDSMFGPLSDFFRISSGRSFISSAGGLFRNPIDGVTPDSLQLRITAPNVDINGVIDALAKENMMSILAEPNLTARSGETASFLAGGEFPVPVSNGNGDNSITVVFREFGVRLSFVPTVLDDARISITVNPEVSELDTGAASISLGNGLRIPGLKVRKASSTVELNSGQSFAFAGLLSRDFVTSVEGTSFLKDIPILGALLRSTRFQKKESELVFIVTPYIVRPAPAGTRLVAPTDNLLPPSDLEMILDQKVARARQVEGATSPVKLDGQKLRGNAGFIVDIE